MYIPFLQTYSLAGGCFKSYEIFSYFITRLLTHNKGSGNTQNDFLNQRTEFNAQTLLRLVNLYRIYVLISGSSQRN